MPAKRYITFEPAEARRIARKLEIHNTPKHGSWLNMAEIELSVFGRECLNRHNHECAWDAKRTEPAKTIN